ncbi:homeodomain transcription factor ste12 [Chytridiales sp. JEL 0842]|nr:homeodomain transcription factor ste12 [Chytridiales sp. JEL 0842]
MSSLPSPPHPVSHMQEPSSTTTTVATSSFDFSMNWFNGSTDNKKEGNTSTGMLELGGTTTSNDGSGSMNLVDQLKSGSGASMDVMMMATAPPTPAQQAAVVHVQPQPQHGIPMDMNDLSLVDESLREGARDVGVAGGDADGDAGVSMDATPGDNVAPDQHDSNSTPATHIHSDHHHHSGDGPEHDQQQPQELQQQPQLLQPQQPQQPQQLVVPQPDIDPVTAQALDSLKIFLATAPATWDSDQTIKRLPLPDDHESVSCVLWNNLFHITGTDIVRSLVFRFKAMGRPVKMMKKFEEGVFSDLRNLKPGVDATLEDPRSEFLEFLFKNNCVRTKKKQKVFYWFSVPHDRLFMDALERDLKREAQNQQPTTIALQPLALIPTLELAKQQCLLPQMAQPLDPWTLNQISADPLAPLSSFANIGNGSGEKLLEPSQVDALLAAQMKKTKRSRKGTESTDSTPPTAFLTPHQTPETNVRMSSPGSVLLMPPTPPTHAAMPMNQQMPMQQLSNNGVPYISPRISHAGSPHFTSTTSQANDSSDSSEFLLPSSASQGGVFNPMASLFEGSPNYKQRRRAQSLLGQQNPLKNQPQAPSSIVENFASSLSRQTSVSDISSLPGSPSLASSSLPGSPALAALQLYNLDTPTPAAPPAAPPPPPKVEGEDLLEIRHPNRLYFCAVPTCGRKFKRFEHLRRHMRCHTGEKPYVCPLDSCRKAFSRSDNLTSHLKIHGPTAAHLLKPSSTPSETPSEVDPTPTSSPIPTPSKLSSRKRKHNQQTPSGSCTPQLPSQPLPQTYAATYTTYQDPQPTHYYDASTGAWIPTHHTQQQTYATYASHDPNGAFLMGHGYAGGAEYQNGGAGYATTTATAGAGAAYTYAGSGAGVYGSSVGAGGAGYTAGMFQDQQQHQGDMNAATAAAAGFVNALNQGAEVGYAVAYQQAGQGAGFLF